MAKKFRSGQKVEFKKKYLDVPKGTVGYFNFYRGDGRGDGGCEVEIHSSAHDDPVAYRPDPAILKPTRKAMRDVVLAGSTATTRSRTVAKKSKKTAPSDARPSKGKRIDKSMPVRSEKHFKMGRKALCVSAQKKSDSADRKEARYELKRRKRAPHGPNCGKRVVSK